ncbi:hypothetical protein NEMIN01_1078 [Nematocida minor]|uniref:uncharacterized protein n=1 Tax=Nematocida minor TaxID=1912983 RepID=UPI00221F9E8D|nr:uncharacterized protein NEMIN01_1078 [Nematocida minor]KAI5190540.1 hypothetical protein NEMIN01_1078 [Nematocida minor]
MEITFLLVLCFTLLKGYVSASSNQEAYVYIGVDSSMFAPTLSVFNGIVTTAGSAQGTKLETKKKTIYEYDPSNSTKGSASAGKEKNAQNKVAYSVYMPQLLATEPVDLVRSINKNVRIKENKAHGSRTINVHGVYSDIPDVQLYLKYLEEAINKKKKENEDVKCLGVTVRGYFEPSTIKTIECAMKELTASISHIQILTDGMAQAVDSIVGVNSDERGYITTHSFRGGSVVSEIFSYELQNKNKKVSLLHQKIDSVYSEYDIIRMLYNHLLSEIKNMASERYPNIAIDLKGVPDLQFTSSSKSDKKEKGQNTNSEKTNTEAANTLKNIDKPVVEYTVDILPLLNSALVNLQELIFSAEKKDSSAIVDDSVEEKDAEDAYTIRIANQNEKSSIHPLLIELVNTAAPCTANNLFVAPISDSVKDLNLNMVPVQNEILQYIANSRREIKHLIVETKEKLSEIEKAKEELKENDKNDKELPVVYRSSIYSDVIHADQLESILYGTGIRKMAKPSKASLSGASTHIMKYNIAVLDERPANDGKKPSYKYKVKYSPSDNGIRSKVYDLNRKETDDWLYFTQNFNNEMKIKEPISALISGDKQSAEYKKIAEVFKGSKQLLSSLEEKISQIMGTMGAEELAKSDGYLEVAQAYTQAVKDQAIDKGLDKSINDILSEIPKLIKKGLKLHKKYEKEGLESTEAFMKFIAQKTKENKHPITTVEYTAETDYNTKLKYKREIKNIIDGIQYRVHLITEEHNENIVKKLQEEVLKKKQEEEAKKAEEEAKPEGEAEAGKEAKAEEAEAAGDAQVDNSSSSGKETAKDKSDETESSTKPASVETATAKESKEPEIETMPADTTSILDESFILKRSL